MDFENYETYFSRELQKHEIHDVERFEKLNMSLARIKGQLSILILLVVGSGISNYFVHGG